MYTTYHVISLIFQLLVTCYRTCCTNLIKMSTVACFNPSNLTMAADAFYKLYKTIPFWKTDFVKFNISMPKYVSKIQFWPTDNVM